MRKDVWHCLSACTVPTVCTVYMYVLIACSDKNSFCLISGVTCMFLLCICESFICTKEQFPQAQIDACKGFFPLSSGSWLLFFRLVVHCVYIIAIRAGLGNMFLASREERKNGTAFQDIVIETFWEGTRALYLLFSLFSGFIKSSLWQNTLINRRYFQTRVDESYKSYIKCKTFPQKKWHRVRAG